MAVILQLSGLGPLRFFGATPDLTPLVVAAVAIYAGSIPGAAMGFGTGLAAGPAGRRDDGAVVAGADRGGLLGRALPRGARPRPRAAPDSGRLPSPRWAGRSPSPRSPSCSTWAPRSARWCCARCSWPRP
ncbi:MAG: hypothetical protein WKF40_10005 [Thermoleophilaceae bacterium]